MFRKLINTFTHIFDADPARERWPTKDCGAQMITVRVMGLTFCSSIYEHTPEDELPRD